MELITVSRGEMFFIGTTWFSPKSTVSSAGVNWVCLGAVQENWASNVRDTPLRMDTEWNFLRLRLFHSRFPSIVLSGHTEYNKLLDSTFADRERCFWHLVRLFRRTCGPLHRVYRKPGCFNNIYDTTGTLYKALNRKLIAILDAPQQAYTATNEGSSFMRKELEHALLHPVFP